jgi:putative endopeptidase
MFRRVLILFALSCLAVGAEDRVPRFSPDFMDPAISPRTNFFLFANGSWVKNNPVPPDKARWASFDELQQRNWNLLRALLESAAADRSESAPGPRRLVGDFFASAMDTNRAEELALRPLREDLQRINELENPEDAARLLGDWHRRGIGACFNVRVGPDAKNSGIYALYLFQGGLGMPDRDYYLADGFAMQREEYRRHVAKMLQITGVPSLDAESMAGAILELETQLASASRTRTNLRDREKNYHRHTLAELQRLAPAVAWESYFSGAGIPRPEYIVVGQPEFLAALSTLATEHEQEPWLAYLRWHLIRSTAPFLHSAAVDESFRFNGTVLQGQPQPEPRWQRAARAIDATVGEAMGQLYVEKHFPAEAGKRMKELVEDLKAVFRDRLARLEWMTPDTRREAQRKFDRFTAKIGHPEVFRDYSAVEVRRDDLPGNVQRAIAAEFRRNAQRIGKAVDRKEWNMTPQTVNAYFNPTQNEIVFPAGILQPPFFDLTMDDAVNYGAIGSIIGHEITHGYDDQGRKSDAEGNLRDWWSAADADEFQRRAEKLVTQYSAYEPLSGATVNGRLTLGENIADLGGVTIAFEALQRAMERDPSRRRTVDGFTPEQRFFIAFAQAWRVNTRDAELRRRLVVDPHAPPQYRAFGPLVNLPAFHEAFGIQPGDLMWKAPEERARIW